MKSLLVVTPRYPYPVIGGDRLRIHQLCQVLSRHFRLTLLSLCDDPETLAGPPPDDGIFERVERVYLPPWRSRLNTLLALPGRTPLQVAYYRSRRFRRRVRALAPEHDGVLAHLVRTAEAVQGLPQPRFLEMTDALSLTYARVKAENGWRPSLKGYAYRLEHHRMAAYERRVVDDFDHSFMISAIDRDHLFASDPARQSRISIAPNGVDLERLPYQFRPSNRELIFIGSLTTLPNLDAAEFMASEVLPLVRRHHPDVQLRVIGRIGTGDRERLERHDGMVVTGEVADIAQAAARGAVGVCPVRMGAGMQNKLLEYMALGLPSVSTPLGLEGLQARDGHELLLARDATGLAQAIGRLLRDRGEAEAIARAARAYIEAQHSRAACMGSVVTAIQRRLARGSG
ncbi:glycosyltransferase [Halomonadaceae bacterium KBTZ08]